MYLKALEIQGFKSFPEKTRLEFDKSITAIVGPNGSGKSNISDALRWVMGEQSTRNLRGGKMEDVIFGGTEKRNPVGFAQVSLIIDNSSRIFNVDNTEIMITRRYYRSGESDYYINRQSVRLRDINELLMDTGLGRDGYSIIGQGRIDEILSVRSSDRREIFEEAAGISRYRYRKEESERKLERTGENLLRVNDKIAELELQVEPLRKQSETAKKFLLLRDELRGLEVSVWCESIDRLRAQSIKIASEYDTAARQLEDSRSSIENIYAEMEKLSEDMHDKEKNAEEQRNVISGMEAQTAELESAIAVLETNIKNCEDVIERINEEISEQENRAIGIGDQISERKSRIVEIDFSRQKLAEEQAALLSEVAGLSENADTAAGELSLILRGIADETELTSGARAKLSALESTVAELKSREETIASEISRIKERLETETQNEKRVRKELSESQDAATSAENIIKGHEIRLLSRKNKASELGDGKTQLTIAKENISSRIALLTEMEKVFAGFSNAVRMVMQESSRGNLRGIHGPVANLIKTEDRYALAVETALGASTQSIIVDSEEAGKAAINLLKRRDGGRGTFLPISTIRGYELNESGVKNEDGFEGYALSLVEFDKKYEGIYASLLGRIVVARDLDSAVKIGKKYSYRFRIVTLDGQVINTGGSMTGGSASKNTGILSRANELKALEIKFEQTQKELSELLTRLSEAERELVSANDEADIARNELRTAQDSMLRLKTESEHLNLLTESLRASLETLEKEGSTIKSRQKELNDAISGLRHEINEREEKVQTLRKRADDISEGKEELRKKNEELSDRIADMRAQAASLDAEKAAISAWRRCFLFPAKTQSSPDAEQSNHAPAFSS